MANSNSALILAEQCKRLALEQWLAASDQAHYRALTDTKTSQTRLRDRLATADLRLSVLLDTNATHDRDGMQATTGTQSGFRGLCQRLSGSPKNIWIRERNQRSPGSLSWAPRQAMCSSKLLTSSGGSSARTPPAAVRASAV